MVVVIFIATIVLQRMAGNQITLLHIIRFKDTLQDTVTSSELKELEEFEHISYSLLQEDF